MLAFTITNSGRTISMSCDDAGIDTLMSAFEKIKLKGGHIHLRSAGQGGMALAEKTPWGEPAIAELVITWAGD